MQAWRNTDIGDPAAAAAGLRAALETPLGPRFGGLRLRDVARADRLDELAFELPLAGGDTPSGRAHARRDRGRPARRTCPRATRSPATPRGSPTRSCAATCGATSRAASTSCVRGGGAYAVVDYKTNWLAAPGEELTAWHYRPAALAAEMQRAHYGAPGPALHRRAAPLPALAAPGL